MCVCVRAMGWNGRGGGIGGTEQGKKNIFSGRVLEIEGLEDLKCEQAFELSDASAERSAAGCTIKLNPEPIKEYMTSNMVMLKWMLSEGYGDKRTIERRIASMQVRSTTWGDTVVARPTRCRFIGAEGISLHGTLHDVSTAAQCFTLVCSERRSIGSAFAVPPCPGAGSTHAPSHIALPESVDY
jgi:hypothetical protein